MKKLPIILTTIFSFGVVLASAQFSVGTKFGATTTLPSAQTGIDAVNNAPKSQTNFHYGIVAGYQLSDRFAILSELSMLQKGFTIDESTSLSTLGINIPVGVQAITQMNYIDLTTLAKLDLVTRGNTSLYGIAGPSISRLNTVNIQPQATLLINFNLPQISVDLSDDLYNRIDVGGVFGIGAEHNVGSVSLFTDARYGHSFSNVFNNTTIDVNYSTNIVALNAGLRYSF